MFRRPECEGVATDCMQMKAVTTCERFITLLQDWFAVFLNCAMFGTEECWRPVTRESWFRFAGGNFRRGYNLFGNELFQLSPLVFSSGHSAAATATATATAAAATASSFPYSFLMFHGLPFSEPLLIMILDVLIGPFPVLYLHRTTHREHVWTCILSLDSNRRSELEKSKNARPLDHSLSNIMSSAYRL